MIEAALDDANHCPPFGDRTRRLSTQGCEAFLAGIASCGVELVQALARDQNLPLTDVKVAITGTMDRTNPVRRGVSVFNSVELRFELAGVSRLTATA